VVLRLARDHGCPACGASPRESPAGALARRRALRALPRQGAGACAQLRTRSRAHAVFEVRAARRRFSLLGKRSAQTLAFVRLVQPVLARRRGHAKPRDAALPSPRHSSHQSANFQLSLSLFRASPEHTTTCASLPARASGRSSYFLASQRSTVCVGTRARACEVRLKDEPLSPRMPLCRQEKRAAPAPLPSTPTCVRRLLSSSDLPSLQSGLPPRRSA
jgi:hypothetical protein